MAPATPKVIPRVAMRTCVALGRASTRDNNSDDPQEGLLTQTKDPMDGGVSPDPIADTMERGILR